MKDDISQMFLRALEIHKAGHLDLAAESYLALLQTSPHHSTALHNMGVVLAQKRKQNEAIAYFDRAIAAVPDYAEAYNNRGNALLALGHVDQAIVSYNKSLKIKPDYGEASLNLAHALMRSNRAQEALKIYSDLLDINPDNYRAQLDFGLANFALGNINDACHCFSKTMALRQSEQNSVYNRDTYWRTTKAKLEHDMEQFRHLSKVGFSDVGFTELAEEYEKLAADIDWSKTPEYIVALGELERNRIADSYNLPLHLLDLPKLENGVINPLLNSSKITERYVNSTPSLTYFDDFLSNDALDQLRNFLLESTVWYDFHHIEGFLAAYLENGLATPLLLQIAHDVKVILPEILGDLPLTQVWAFKNLQENQGIDLHSDSGAVSLNFWLTPDEANLDPNHGGIVIYETAPPKDWQLKSYSEDIKLIQNYLSGHSSKTTCIPYRENRAVLFKSELFHKSDHMKFKPEYKSHRINITMIFGFGGLA